MLDFIRDLTKPAEERRRERVTAYVDGQLSARERARFEAQLQDDPALRAEVAAEERVRTAVRLLQARQRPVPRSFTLDPAKFGAPQPAYSARAYPALRVATALAAFVFVFVFTLALINTGGGVTQLAASDAPAAEVMATAADETPANDAEMASFMVAEEPLETTEAQALPEMAMEAAPVIEETPAGEDGATARALPEATPVPGMGGGPEIDATVDALYGGGAAVDATPAAEDAPALAVAAAEMVTDTVAAAEAISETFALQQSDTSSPDSIATEVLPPVESVVAEKAAPARSLTIAALAAGGLFAVLLIATLLARRRRL